MSARSRIRRLRRGRAYERARLRWSIETRMERGGANVPFVGIVHPTTMEYILSWENPPVDRTRRGWNRFPGWTCQLCGRAGHVGPCRKRRNRDTFLKPPRIARILGRALLKLAKDLPR